MPTLKDVLIRRYGYRRGDFGTAGLVRVDCEVGILSPVPLHDIFTPHDTHPEKVVRLAALFQAQQRVAIGGVGREQALAFRVLLVSGDGLFAQMGPQRRRFLPWSSLRHGLLRPDLIVFTHDFPRHPIAVPPGESAAKKAAKSLCASPRLAL